MITGLNVKDKKGNIFDIPETGFVIFGVVLTLFIVYIIMSNFGTAIIANNSTNITSVVTLYQSSQTKLINGWDYGVLLIAILFPLVSFFLARKIPSETIVMVLTFIILPIIFILMMTISNIHGGMMDNTTYAAFINSTIFIKFLLPKLGIYSVIYSIFVLIGLYSKPD